MIHVTFKADNTAIEAAEQVYQWDVGQTIQLEGLAVVAAPKVHFTNKGLNIAYSIQAQMTSDGNVQAAVPDQILQMPYDIVGYVYVEKTDTDKETINEFKINLIPRAKPEDYTSADIAEITQVNTFLEGLQEAFENSEARFNDNVLAIANGGTGASTAAGARENLGIEYMEDYVVENGIERPLDTEGNNSVRWQWRLWNSGFFEAWTTEPISTGTLSGMTAVSGSNQYYSAPVLLSLPHRFITDTSVMAELTANSYTITNLEVASEVVQRKEVTGTNNGYCNYITIRVIKPTSSTASVSYFASVKGRWM